MEADNATRCERYEHGTQEAITGEEASGITTKGLAGCKPDKQRVMDMGQYTGKPTRPDWHAAWTGVRESLRRELGDPVFDAWIGPLTLEAVDKDELSIGAAKPFVRNWVANHYVTRIERAFRAEGAEPASLSIVMLRRQPALAAA